MSTSESATRLGRRARVAAAAILAVLAMAAVFFSGTYFGTHYGGGDYYAGPADGNCVQLICQPAGPKSGAHCYQRIVPCP